MIDQLEEEVKTLIKQSEDLKRRVDQFLAKEYLFLYKLEGKLNPKKRKKDLKVFFK